MDLGAMPNPNKGDEFNQRPRYALCYGHFMLYLTGSARICLKSSARIWLKAHYDETWPEWELARLEVLGIAHGERGLIEVEIAQRETDEFA